MPLPIAIADDHQLIADGLAAIIREHPDLELVGTARNGKEAIKLVSLFKPRIIFMDIDMPVMNGLEAIAVLQKDHPDTSIIVLTMHGNPSLVRKVISLGAKGYLLKNADREEFLEALSKVAAGKSYFSPELTRALADGSGKPASFPGGSDAVLFSQLTSREIEILKMIAEGYSNKEIGDRLFISHRTVDTHRTNLMKKLEVHNIAGLIKFAFNNGLTG